MKLVIRLMSLALGLVFVTSGASSQEKKIKANFENQLDQPLPMDPSVRIGKLKNGLTYYIRKNGKPADKIEFRLAINAGSILEDEKQRGLAHFIEHMAFNGSKNFKKNDLINYLQSIGVEFGADLNAYTSFDETVYMLPIPSGDEEILEKGLQVLEDWAGNLELSEAEIDKERGVVIEEWRLGRGADQRMRDAWFPVMYKGSRYAERLPIGTKDVIENASYETIRQFYKDWYRPDLMSIIAVGDLDLDEMEQKIKAKFSKLKNPKNSRKRETYGAPDHEETLIAIEGDKEASFTQVRIVYKQGKEEGKTLADFRKGLSYSLYNTMLNQRLNELRQSAEPPFVFGSTSYGGSFVKGLNQYSSFAMVGENDVEKGIKALLTENERVKQYGFTKGELERAKKQLLNSLEKSAKEQDKTESGNYARQYVEAFLEAEVVPSQQFTFDFASQVFKGINVEEINQYAGKWIKDKNRVIVVTGPEKEGLEPVSSDVIRKLLNEVSQMEIKAYEDNVSGAKLMAKLPVKGEIKKEKSLTSVGAEEITLSNGIRVILKPTDFKNDEVLMTAFSYGGHSVYNDESYVSASNAGQIIGSSGVGEFSNTDLTKLFAGKTVRVSPFIGAFSEGFNGTAAPKDLETMMQLINLYFTAPRKDEKAFASFKSRNTMLFQNLMSNPQFFFQDQSIKIMSQNHPRAGGFPTAEDLEKVDLELAYKIYKERFQDPGSFTFVFVGNFEKEKIKSMLTTYLASIPEHSKDEIWRDLGIRPPKGKVEKVIYRGTDPKSQVSINFQGEAAYDKVEDYYLTSLGAVLSNRLIDILREEKSGVYGVGARGGMDNTPYDSYNFRVSFPCAPENIAELTQAVYSEIENIKKNGVSQEDLDEVKEAQRINREEQLKENRYWLNNLRTAYFDKEGLDDFYDYEKMVESITVKDLKKIANKYLSEKNRVEIVLKPEKGE